MTDKSGPKPASGRQQRLGAALRANLKRRKEQARERAKEGVREASPERADNKQPAGEERS
ncbi:MAG: hypothetical protein ACOY4O_04735 [Pseudomonadota bacterium]|jgi:hypothetical protein